MPLPPPIDLQLDREKAKLKEALQCTDEFCSALHREYLRFWALKKTYKDKHIIPSLYLDKLWHLHILDTKKYREDCERLLGAFWDHSPQPFVSPSHPEPTAAEAYTPAREHSALDDTRAAYVELFGETPPPGIWSDDPPCD